MYRQTLAFEHFAVAVALNAWPLCGQIIYDMAEWNGYVDTQMHSVIDLRSWSPDKVGTVHEFSSLFLFGITRAFLAAYDTQKGVSYQRMGRAFT